MTNEEPMMVGGRYELGELLGRGGMAEVRKGTDSRLGRVVAVKRLRTDLASDATFQARFRREAQSSASLNHPAIVAVYDTGEEMSDDGVAQPYIVMEYVAGRTLRDILREGRKILPERALEITSGVLSALDYSHRAGIIHRDIKPANVMLTPGGDVKVMDFGIARAVSDASSTMTQTAAVVGTAQYLSPEQARGETVDSRSDVYSTGCLLYELLTGRPPFVGESPVAVAYQHVREPAQPPSTHDTELTPEVDAIVMKALAKRLEDRYQSAAAMRSDIERYLAGRPVQAPSVAAAAAAPVAGATTVLPAAGPRPGTTTATAPVREDEDPSKRTGLWILLGVLLLALVAAGIWMYNNNSDDPVEQVAVPDVAGMTQARAVQALKAEELVPVIEEAAHDTVAEGKVIDTDPEGGTDVDPGSEVTVTVSTGKPDLQVPTVLGLTRAEAEEKLTTAGFKVTFQERDTDEPKNQVVDQTPAADTKVSYGSAVTVFVSDGPEEVPYVVGKTREEATKALEDAGFKVYVDETDEESDAKPGEVVDQSTAKGDTADQGTEIRITVSTYEAPSETPTASETPTTTELPTGLPTDETTP
ncbi:MULTISPECIES: Stk1 family PASTA domain-containing Ser/Thr kinase [unclassified Nocardioides]|uniref:Stk1 family PASTA domain-containing Ser/Thr kinase n=1 Tax=unclassified Nocardioides TaxID=2615069 RepID=UPI0007028749|nr:MULTISPECIES: Stk1 family PASTA domain-containing Ser/Thr kinase [unclassified Nocardioides]KQZ76189.1 protein kinase [Nocardioides sp. Root151]KRF20360.1 protein kinase [Nocardioides sp. Soil796]